MSVTFAEAGRGDELLKGGFVNHALCSHITDNNATAKVRESPDYGISPLTYIADVDERPPHFLREWRKHSRMTQQELADAIGTTKSVISDLERGELQLSPKWLRRLAPVLKTQPGHILDHDPETLDSDIIDIWAHIDDRDREQAIRVLRSFVRTGTSD